MRSNKQTTLDPAVVAKAREMITHEMDQIRQALDDVEGTLWLLARTPQWRAELAEATDEFHRVVHRVINLFDLSSTPASELRGEPEPDDVRRWSAFDE